mmetsp:Transcript_17063/g.44997  ORF Transcript_17063/g.44997 Transcript_17063/m.44997 type:complete len:202 (-) Transcript_17063:231-836(-)
MAGAIGRWRATAGRASAQSSIGVCASGRSPRTSRAPVAAIRSSRSCVARPTWRRISLTSSRRPPRRRSPARCSALSRAVAWVARRGRPPPTRRRAASRRCRPSSPPRRRPRCLAVRTPKRSRWAPCACASKSRVARACGPVPHKRALPLPSTQGGASSAVLVSALVFLCRRRARQDSKSLLHPAPLPKEVQVAVTEAATAA